MPVALPKPSAVEGWVKAKATEIKGEERGRSLYHFEFWLEAPDDVKRRLVAVAYEFNTPAVMPQSQVSSEAKDRLPHLRRRSHLRRQGHRHAEIQGRPIAAGRRRWLPAGGLDAAQRTPATSATSSRKRGLWLSI